MKRYNWKPYVPVSKRREQALKKIQQLRKKGIHVQPVEIKGRKIARTFWGEAWCDHLESFSDYENRLPRGRGYVRNGSVCHLDIDEGEINSVVSGSKVYKVQVTIETLSLKRWEALKDRCAGQIGSILELLKGSLSKNVMGVVTDRRKGLFPLPGEMSFKCSCPDWALMCKHVAAVLYGVGARLDEKPELLFHLRGVDHEELITSDVEAAAAAASGSESKRKQIGEDDLSDMFGIEIANEATPDGAKSAGGRKKAARSRKVSKAGAKRQVRRKPKSKAGTKRREARGSKRRGSRKTGAKKTSGNGTVTGKNVAALRAKFGMTQQEFAGLLGVSTPSVRAWEKKRGALKLQVRTLSAWNAVKGLTKRQARRKLQGSQ